MAKLLTYEDIPEGVTIWGEEVVADRDAMVAYAQQYDPWPFHIDADAARKSIFGGLTASAGYTFSLWCKAVHSIIRTPDAEWAFLGGYDLHVQLLQPVRPGDRLRLKVTINHKRLSSKPGRGHVDSLHVFVRETIPVFSVQVRFLIATRDAL